MASPILFLALAILILPALTIKNEAVLSITWLQGHCEAINNECDPTKIALWDHQSFTIHGLWPARQTYKDYGKFNFQYFKGTPLLEQMLESWPPQPKKNGNVHFLWDYQWANYGARYADILLRLRPSDFSYAISARNKEVQIAYFKDTFNTYRNLNVRKVAKGSYTKAEFATLMKLPSTSFYLVCTASGALREIRICYNITANGFVSRNCHKSTSNCPAGAVTLKGWQNSNQDIVYESPEIETPLPEVNTTVATHADFIAEQHNQAQQELLQLDQPEQVVAEQIPVAPIAPVPAPAHQKSAIPYNVRIIFEIIIVVCFWILLIYCYRTLTKKKANEAVAAEGPVSELREGNTKAGEFKVEEEVERQDGINQTNGGFEMRDEMQK